MLRVVREDGSEVAVSQEDYQRAIDEMGTGRNCCAGNCSFKGINLLDLVYHEMSCHMRTIDHFWDQVVR